MSQFYDGDSDSPDCEIQPDTQPVLRKSQSLSLTEKQTISSEPHRYKLEFSGSAGEYFRIWIVNTFLTIITLGIYSAWAKVRTRQYFYAHTGLAGHSFEYLAKSHSHLQR